METTKQKVDVAAIVAKANESKNAVKASTEKVQSKKEDFRIVPKFTKYEFNGNILRNVKTKNIVSMKTGRTKYQIKDDAGKSHNLSKDEIKALFPANAKAASAPKEKKQKKEKAPKVAKVALSHDAPKESVNDILAMDCKGHKKHFLLHLKGKSNQEIHDLTKSPLPSIARDIWRYNTGKTALV